MLARRDVLGIAQTGTGKTAAFTLPMLTLLETGRARARMPRTLILEPTRELAAQVEESFDRYGVNHRLSVALLIGGMSFGDQDIKITRGVDVLIATPGRLLDHFERGKLLLTGVELLVIDEADRMLDMGFIPDIERIVKLVPFTRQTLFFSATMPPEIQRLADAFLHNPVRIEVSRPASRPPRRSSSASSPPAREPHEKRDTLRDLIRGAPDLKNAIIFCNRKSEVAVLHKSLLRHGFNAAALHGDMDQRARMAALESFRNGDVPLLVASDVAARGLDIPAVSHVFNYDVPHHPEDYVHRVGRTGRAGRTGHAITIVAPGDERSLAAIERLTSQAIAWEGPSAAGAAGRADASRRAQRPARERRGRAAATRARRARPVDAERTGQVPSGDASRPSGEREPWRLAAERRPRARTAPRRQRPARARRGPARDRPLRSPPARSATIAATLAAMPEPDTETPGRRPRRPRAGLPPAPGRRQASKPRSSRFGRARYGEATPPVWLRASPGRSAASSARRPQTAASSGSSAAALGRSQ